MFAQPTTEKTINGRVYHRGFRLPFSQSSSVLKEKHKLIHNLKVQYGRRPLVVIRGRKTRHWIIKPVHAEPMLSQRVQKTFAEKLKNSGKIRSYKVRKFTEHKLTGSGYGYVLEALFKHKHKMRVI